MLEIKLGNSEYAYLCRVRFMQEARREILFSVRQQMDDVYFINISENQADVIRDLCGEQLQVAGFNEKYELTPEGEILESLVDKLRPLLKDQSPLQKAA